MEITERRLTRSEAIIIFDEIKKTDKITGYTISQLQNLKKMIIACDGEKIVGILSFMEYPKYIDLKLIIVLEAYRRKGVGKMLYNYFYQKEGGSGKVIYTITSSPAIISLIRATGFRKISFFNLPISAQLHQSFLIFSLFRIKEFFRKKILFTDEKFSYWIK